MTTLETKPIGSTISANTVPGAVVFGLDDAGNIALAATVVDGKANFSAEGSVLAFGTAILRAASRESAPDVLATLLRNADGFDGLSKAVSTAVLDGKNPLDQQDVVSGFDRVLSSAAKALAAPQSALMRPLAIGPHLEPVFEPSLFETGTFKITLANRYYGVPTFSEKVYLRNTSTLSFRVALLSASEAQASSDPLKGVGASIVPFTSGTFIKPFAGPFSVRLTVDDVANIEEFLKGAVGLVAGITLDSDCTNKLVESALKVDVSIAFADSPKEWMQKALEKIPDAIWSCFKVELRGAPRDILKAYGKIDKAVGIGRLALDRMALKQFGDGNIPDAGVCVDQQQYQISCVAKIESTPINPMMPGTFQPMRLSFLRDNGQRTTAPPHGLDIQYSASGLVLLDQLDGNIIGIFSGAMEGRGEVTLTDPATGVKLVLPISVTNGKLDSASYSVPTNGTTKLRLVDPLSGMEVFRSPAFDIFLADSRYGTFSTKTSSLGEITFSASNLVTPAAQNILLGTGFSGSRIIVTPSIRVTLPPRTEFWTGDYYYPMQVGVPDPTAALCVYTAVTSMGATEELRVDERRCDISAWGLPLPRGTYLIKVSVTSLSDGALIGTGFSAPVTFSNGPGPAGVESYSCSNGRFNGVVLAGGIVGSSVVGSAPFNQYATLNFDSCGDWQKDPGSNSCTRRAGDPPDTRISVSGTTSLYLYQDGWGVFSAYINGQLASRNYYYGVMSVCQ